MRPSLPPACTLRNHAEIPARASTRVAQRRTTRPEYKRGRAWISFERTIDAFLAARRGLSHGCSRGDPCSRGGVVGLLASLAAGFGGGCVSRLDPGFARVKRCAARRTKPYRSGPAGPVLRAIPQTNILRVPAPGPVLVAGPSAPNAWALRAIEPSIVPHCDKDIMPCVYRAPMHSVQQLAM